MGHDAGRTLRALDAWAAALAWREQLQGRVRLEVDLNECDDDDSRVAPSRFTVIDRFEWVTFVFNGFQHEGFRAVGDIADVVSAARAATTVWYALSCCPGFGGAENPDFWRCVFTELASPLYGSNSSNRRRTQRPITEAVRFFDDPQKPFPRVRLVPKSQDTQKCLRRFLRSTVGGHRHDQEMQRILESLSQFIRASRWSRGIPVAVDEVPVDLVAKVLPSLQIRCTPHAHGPRSPPHFQLDAVYLQGKDLLSLSALRQILVFSHANMVVRRCDSADLAALLSAPEDTQAKLRRRVCVGTVDIIRPTESASHIAAMCAAMPSSEWISACRVFSFGVPTPKSKLHQINMAWLAYVIFHPDSATTGSTAVTDLEISSYRFPVDLIRILRSMSTGNKLLTLLTGDSKGPVSNAYFAGKIEAATVARAKPNRFSHSVYTFPAETWVTICTTTVNTTMMDNWVGAVIPGVGLAWIRKESIRAVTKRPAAASCVRRLRVSIGEDPHSALMSLLGLLGPQLEYLDLTEVTLHPILTEHILRLCPRLKSMRITYATRPWSDERPIDANDHLAQLEELELVLPTEFPPQLTMETLCSAALVRLKTLRVVMPFANAFSLSRDNLLATLAKFPSIQYAHWHASNGSMRRTATGMDEALSYTDRQRRSRNLLGDLSSWGVNILNGPLKLPGRCAFLSVVRHEALRDCTGTPSLVGRLGLDLLRIIFSFVPVTNAREVYISDSEER